MEYKKMLFISIFLFLHSSYITLHYIQHTLHYISNEMMYIERINNNIQMFDFQCYTHVSVMFVLLFKCMLSSCRLAWQNIEHDVDGNGAVIECDDRGTVCPFHKSRCGTTTTITMTLSPALLLACIPNWNIMDSPL